VTARRCPQTLVVEFEDGSLETRNWDDDRRWHRFLFHKPVKGKTAWLDADRRFLSTINKLNDGRTRVSKLARRRAAGRATGATIAEGSSRSWRRCDHLRRR